MTERNHPRVIQRIVFSDHPASNCQPVFRDEAGGIDYDFYHARARQARSDAYFNVFGALYGKVRRIFARPPLVDQRPKSQDVCEGLTSSS